ncbi:MAG: molecular chaperone HscC [Eubacteriales bacterium]|nr:molecular chaperone HscC [Eubacteriales bacterium]
MAIIGIDLGTTNSLAAVWKDGRPVLIPNTLGTYLTPSVVYVDTEKNVWTGAAAKEKRYLDPHQGAASFKRAMGTSQRYRLFHQTFTPQELSALILKQLKADTEAFLGEPVEEAVISVPAYFNDEQRYATREAGALAGLRVERLVNEPSAAALACRMETGEENCEFLVIDFGGGTLDVSVVECFEQIIEIQAVAGDNHLGGDDFDRRIAEHFCEQHNLVFDMLSEQMQTRLLKQCEQCKRTLTTEPAAMLEYPIQGETLGLILTPALLIEICAPLLVRIEQAARKALSDARKDISDIDQIVLVGGSCKMPVVRRFLTQALGKEPFLAGQPDEIVALGAGIYAGIKERKSDIRDVLLTDICPFTLGVAIVNHDDSSNPLMSPLIERNSTLPVSRSGVYFTAGEQQTKIKVEIFQGESRYCHNNLRLGSLEINVPPAPVGQETVVVRFAYDINGILQVDVQNRLGQKVETTIIKEQIRLSPEELEARMQELSALKCPPREQAENLLLMSRGERLYEETLGEDRELVNQLLNWFSQVLRTGGPASIAAAHKTMAERLDWIEQKLTSPL